jgi:hypothetical protein|tara:strand:- start:810 stop:1022 length:213 start_codon:yes stop_codon:yes gene_type:complete
MTYSKIEHFVKDFGVRKYFYCDYFFKLELNGLTKNEIQSRVIQSEIVKSPLSLSREYKFYEKMKGTINWI